MDKLVVTPDKFANRLRAYLHQKGLHGTAGGQFLRDELDRLATSIRSLIAFQSKAHDPVGRDDVRSVALATYFPVGEIVFRTDLQPIETYASAPVAEHERTLKS